MVKFAKSKFISFIVLVVVLFNFTASNTIVYAVDTETPEDEATEQETTQQNTILTEEDVEEVAEVLGTEKKVSGGVLYESFIKFIAAVGDLFVKFLQYCFLGEDFWDIKKGDQYYIFYGPAQIFSNKIPALDINFVKPNEQTLTATTTAIETKRVAITEMLASNGEFVDERNYTTGKDSIIEEFKNGHGYTQEQDKTKSKSYNGANATGVGNTNTEQINENLEYAWYNQNDNSVYVIVDRQWSQTMGNNMTTSNKIVIYKTTQEKYDEIIESDQITVEGDSELATVERTSSALTLQPIIATWYNILRTVALVGLLSALVYIGIRIVISSTAAEQGKYKKLLVNWVAAICLLYLLHYMMVGILAIVDFITNILAPTIGESNVLNVEPIMNGIRNTIGADPSKYSAFPELIMYIVLVIYTIVFTFHYLKRVLYMAFLTMIAPLIALTYPLDKIKDSKSQAFDMWLKEYIFNALLQVIHLVIYTVLVSSALELVEENPIYAIVAIGFLIPAEKLIKKMFGFENKESTGTFEAAAAGALTMNAINSIASYASSQGGSKGEGNSSNGNTNAVVSRNRTAGGQHALPDSVSAWANTSSSGGDSESADGYNIPTGSGANANPNPFDLDFDENDLNKPQMPKVGTPPNVSKGKQGSANTGGSNTSGYNPSTTKSKGKSGAGSYGANNTYGTGSGFPSGLQTGNGRGKTDEEREMELLAAELMPKGSKGANNRSIIEGVKALAKEKHFVRRGAKGVAKFALGSLGAITAGTLGLAAGITSGDLSKAATYAVTGLTAGRKIGGSAVDKAEGVAKSAKSNYEIFRQGYEGTDFEQNENRRLDEKFKRDGEAISKYRANFGNYRKAMDVALRFREQGITDDDKIIAAIKIGLEEKKSIDKMISVAKNDKVLTDAQYQKSEIRKDYTERLQKRIHERLERMNNPTGDSSITERNAAAAKSKANEMMGLLGRLKKIDF